MVEIKVLSEEGACLREIDILRLGTAKKKLAAIWHDVCGKLGKARIVEVLVKGRKLLADAKTGSLFCPDSLRCLSSVELSIRY
jgi:HD superfamily phosphohydrolase YqeK